jgi:hypothetical protein
MMAKLLAQSLLFASALLLQSTSGLAQDAPKLTQDDLEKPAVVKAWLIENGAKADKKAAKEFFDLGQKLKKEKRWALATKAFGGSAIRYPTPQALNEYAETSIRDLGIRLDAQHVVPLYQSAIAADTILHLMSEEEKNATQNNLDCLRVYMQAKKVQPDCHPLQAYGLSK